ncbi:hypothetical protein HRbin27_00470 [bacterium HR27]|nr:hypothetical protein HRbin27_00470 [bacterium HR27]
MCWTERRCDGDDDRAATGADVDATHVVAATAKALYRPGDEEFGLRPRN